MPKAARTVPPPKQAVFQIRLDAALVEKAQDKAQPLGGLSAVIRAMLRRWVESGGVITDDEILQELIAAPRRPRKPAK
jgi:hypothetical protein